MHDAGHGGASGTTTEVDSAKDWYHTWASMGLKGMDDFSYSKAEE